MAEALAEHGIRKIRWKGTIILAWYAQSADFNPNQWALKHFNQVSEEIFSFLKGHSDKLEECMFAEVEGSSFFK